MKFEGMQITRLAGIFNVILFSRSLHSKKHKWVELIKGWWGRAWEGLEYVTVLEGKSWWVWEMEHPDSKLLHRCDCSPMSLCIPTARPTEIPGISTWVWTGSLTALNVIACFPTHSLTVIWNPHSLHTKSVPWRSLYSRSREDCCLSAGQTQPYGIWEDLNR